MSDIDLHIHVAETAQIAFEEHDDSYEVPLYYNVGNLTVGADGSRTFQVQAVDSDDEIIIGRYHVTVQEIAK